MKEEAFVEHNSETEHTKEINGMQMELVEKWSSVHPVTDDIFINWVGLYSEEFRVILDKILDEAKEEEKAEGGINFWEKFKDEHFRAEILQRIEEELYPEE